MSVGVGASDQPLLERQHLAGGVDRLGGGEGPRARGPHRAELDHPLAGEEAVGEALDLVDRGSLLVCGGELLEQLAAGEGRALRREGALDLLEEPRPRAASAETTLRPKRRLDLEPGFPRPLAPLAPQLVAVEASILGLAGGEGRHLRCLRGTRAADLRAAPQPRRGGARRRAAFRRGRRRPRRSRGGPRGSRARARWRARGEAGPGRGSRRSSRGGRGAGRRAPSRPSADLTRLATRTWVWSWGSPARLIRWRKAAAMKPEPLTAVWPSVPRRV